MANTEDANPNHIIKDVRCIMSEVETRKNLDVRLLKRNGEGNEPL
jgi:hypothetical protein